MQASLTPDSSWRDGYFTVLPPSRKAVITSLAQEHAVLGSAEAGRRRGPAGPPRRTCSSWRPQVSHTSMPYSSRMRAGRHAVDAAASPMNSASSTCSRGDSGRRPATGDCPAFDASEVVDGRTYIVPPDVADCRVGAAAKPNPLAVGPVFHVVARAPAGLRHVRDSGPARSRPPSRRAIARRYMSAASSSGARDQPAARHLLAQRCVGIHLQQVERGVLGTGRR